MFKVYKLTSPEGKSYIGVTGQKYMSMRWGNGKNYRYNKHLWEDIQKFSWEAFSHEVIEEYQTREEAWQREIELIKQLNTTNPEYGYNQSTGGAGFNGIKLSEERKKYLSECFKGRQLHFWTDEERKRASERMKGRSGYTKGISLSEEHKQRISEGLKGHKGCEYNKVHYSKGVIQYDLQGNEIARFYSQKEAVRQTGVNVSSIHYCCEGKYKTAGGYIWKYAKENEDEVGRMLNERIC